MLHTIWNETNLLSRLHKTFEAKNNTERIRCCSNFKRAENPSKFRANANEPNILGNMQNIWVWSECCQPALISDDARAVMIAGPGRDDQGWWISVSEVIVTSPPAWLALFRFDSIKIFTKLWWKLLMRTERRLISDDPDTLAVISIGNRSRVRAIVRDI